MINEIKKIIRINRTVKARNAQNRKSVIDTGVFFREMVKMLTQEEKDAEKEKAHAPATAK